MYRYVSFIVIFSIVSVMLYFHNESSHFTAANHAYAHQENYITIPASERTPSITGSVVQDPSGTWLLQIVTENFHFAPEKVGTESVTYNEGHAHIYINGEKINRLYGNYYNLDKLESGTHEIKVTLNGNNHGVFIVDGKEVVYKETIVVS